VRGCRRIEQTHNTSVETLREFTEIKETGFGKAGKMFLFLTCWCPQEKLLVSALENSLINLRLPVCLFFPVKL
jgi:hypothetical protein